MPGPQFPLYMAGARLEANYPISVITDGMGLNITVMSYCGQLDFGIVADREQMPDVWSLIGSRRVALDELRPGAAGPTPATRQWQRPRWRPRRMPQTAMAEQFCDVGGESRSATRRSAGPRLRRCC